MALALAAPAAADPACAGLDPAAAAKFTSVAADCPVTAGEATDVAVAALPASVVISFSGAAPAPGGIRPARHRVAGYARPAYARPDGLVGAVAARHRIDPLLLDAIIARESAGRASAVSVKGARGLMQVMPATGRALGVSDPRDLADPAVNLVAGATYLKQMQARFGNSLPLTLAAYNAGPGAVARHGGVPPYAETRAYVAAILDRYAAARRSAGR